MIINGNGTISSFVGSQNDMVPEHTQIGAFTLANIPDDVANDENADQVPGADWYNDLYLTVHGSLLEYAGTYNGNNIDNLSHTYNMGAPPGTWRAMQPYPPNGVHIDHCQLIYQRIA